MVFFRGLILLCLLAAIVSFAFYAGTGQARFKKVGLRIVQWTLFAAFCFFAVLIVQRIV